MLRIDAHQHFWKFNPVRDAWIDETMSVIQKDFSPADLKPLLDANGIDACVTVQADQSISENDFLIDLANRYDFIRGVVGWIDLQASDVREQLEKYREVPKLKGFRHVLQGEQQRDFMLRPAFKRGIAALHPFGYTYDILIFPDQLPYTRTFIESFPYQPFVIDHLAKPYIRDRKLDEWKKDILSLAKYENVCCKVSGMVTEATWKNWKQDDFKPYLETVLEAFGTSRLMFGSDWPVCLVAAQYNEVIGIINTFFSTFSLSDQSAIFGGTAKRFYNV